MAAVTWKLARLANNGELRTLEGWGIKSATLSLVNQGVDTLELGFAGNDLLGNSPFGDAELLRLDRVVETAPDVFTSTTVFRGRVIGRPRGAAGSSEGLTIVVAGPFWYLTQLVYTQLRLFGTDAMANPTPPPPRTYLLPEDFTLVSKTTSLVTLSRDQQGTRVSSSAQIVDVINAAIAKGALMQIGTIDAGIDIPRDGFTDTICSEIIAKALRWTPDQSVWFDYTFNPPKINIRTKANRSLLTIDIADATVQEVEINPREDLAVSGVTINFLRKNQRDGVQFETLDKDTAGPIPEGIGSLVLTVELWGTYLAYVTDGSGGPPTRIVVASEPLPIGLAAMLYSVFGVAPYEGRILLVQDECDAISWISKKLSIAHGSPDWTTARMIVQQTSQDIFAGRTEITIGPPRQLGPQDLLGLVRQAGTTSTVSIVDLIPVPPIPPPPNYPSPTSPDPRLIFGSFQPDLILRTHQNRTPAGIPLGFSQDVCNAYATRGGTLLGTLYPSGFNAIGDKIEFHNSIVGLGPPTLTNFNYNYEAPFVTWSVYEDDPHHPEQS